MKKITILIFMIAAAVASADLKDGGFDSSVILNGAGDFLVATAAGIANGGWVYHGTGGTWNPGGHFERTAANPSAARGVGQVWTDTFSGGETLTFDYSSTPGTGGYSVQLIGMTGSGSASKNRVSIKGTASVPWHGVVETGVNYTMTIILQETIVAPTEAGTYQSAVLDMGAYDYYVLAIVVEGTAAIVDNVSVVSSAPPPQLGSVFVIH